jgi:DNA modification methylase
MTFDTIYNDDCLPFLHGIPDDSIDCCITSPPYFALRDYGIPCQIGLEDSPEEYIAHLCAVFAQVLRVLKPEGTVWLNMGDTYNGYRGNACRSNNEKPYAHPRHPHRDRGGWHHLAAA